MTADFAPVDHGVLRRELAAIQTRLNRVMDLLDPVTTLSAAERSYALWLKASLSPREREVLDHVICGRGRRRIAEAMGITQNTARTYLQNLRHKFGVGTVVEVVVVAVRYGIVDLRRGDPLAGNRP